MGVCICQMWVGGGECMVFRLPFFYKRFSRKFLQSAFIYGISVLKKDFWIFLVTISLGIGRFYLLVPQLFGALLRHLYLRKEDISMKQHAFPALLNAHGPFLQHGQRYNGFVPSCSPITRSSTGTHCYSLLSYSEQKGRSGRSGSRCFWERRDR